MAAIAASAVSLYPTDGGGSFYPGRDGEIVTKRLKITSVTAADTATAAVLGFSKVISADSGYNASVAAAVGIGVDPVNNGIYIGSGPFAATIYLVVTGTPPIAR
jgi:hypothetical protein